MFICETCDSLKIKLMAIVLTETNVTINESDPFYINGYNKFILDRTFNPLTNKFKHKGSGIAIFLDQKIDNASINDSCTESTNDGEFLSINFRIDSTNYTIMAVYRPPSGNPETFLNHFDDIINIAHKNRSSKIIVAGDFNFNLYNPIIFGMCLYL